MYGYFMTNRGVEKVSQAAKEGRKIQITTYAVGDGGDKAGPFDYSISALNNEVYRKQLDDSDTYEAVGSKLRINVIIPDSAPEMTFNEAGYFDSDGELIIYGVQGDMKKGASVPGNPQIVEHENYLQFTQTTLDSLEIISGGDVIMKLSEKVDGLTSSLSTLEGKINGYKNDLEPRVKALEDTLANLAETLEGLI